MKRLARQVLTILGGRIGAAGMQAAGMLLLARWSNVGEFGVAAAALGVLVVLQVLGDLGATPFSTREVASNGLTPVVHAAAMLSQFGTAALAAGSVVLLVALGAIFHAIYFELIPLAFWLVAERSIELRASVALATGNARFGTTALIARRFLGLVGFTSCALADVRPVFAYAIGMSTASLLVFALIRAFSPRTAAPSGHVRLSSAFVACKPYWTNSLSLQSRNLDSVVVATVLGSTQAAYFGIASRLMTPLRMVPTAIATALLPHLASNGRRGSARLLGLVSLAMSIPYGLMALGAPWIISLALGASYLPAIVPVQVMLVSLMVSSSTSILTASLQAFGSARAVSQLSFIVSVSYLGLVAGGARIGDATGAAVGAAVGLVLQMVALLVLHVRMPTAERAGEGGR